MNLYSTVKKSALAVYTAFVLASCTTNDYGSGNINSTITVNGVTYQSTDSIPGLTVTNTINRYGCCPTDSLGIDTTSYVSPGKPSPGKAPVTGKKPGKTPVQSKPTKEQPRSVDDLVQGPGKEVPKEEPRSSTQQDTTNYQQDSTQQPVDSIDCYIRGKRF